MKYLINSNYFLQLNDGSFRAWAPGETCGSFFHVSKEEEKRLKTKIKSGKFLEVKEFPKMEAQHLYNLRNLADDPAKKNGAGNPLDEMSKRVLDLLFGGKSVQEIA